MFPSSFWKKLEVVAILTISSFKGIFVVNVPIFESLGD